MSILYAPGIPSSQTYPYQEDVQHTGIYPCRYNYNFSVGTTTGYERILADADFSEDKLKNYIFAEGPVAFALNADPDTFIYYKSGIYDDPDCTNDTIHHSALLYGFGTAKFKSGKTIDYWMAKNSWSNSWGDNGYFRIVRGKNMCGKK